MTIEWTQPDPTWPPGTHQFRNLAEMTEAINASQEARHHAEVRWVQGLSSEQRWHYLSEAKKKRGAERYARLSEDLREARRARAEVQAEDDLLEVMI